MKSGEEKLIIIKPALLLQFFLSGELMRKSNKILVNFMHLKQKERFIVSALHYWMYNNNNNYLSTDWPIRIEAFVDVL